MYPCFEQVDLVEMMKKVLAFNTIQYLSDLDYDVGRLEKQAESETFDENFLWVCLKDGTYLFSERELFVSHSGDYQTFSSATSCEERNPLVFLVEPHGNSEGSISGRMTLVDHQVYLNDMESGSQKPTEVLLTFHNENEQISFDMEEYRNHHSSLIENFCQYSKRKLIVPNETELLKAMSLARSRVYGEAELTPISEYFEELSLKRAEEYKDIPYYFDRFQEEEEISFDEDENER